MRCFDFICRRAHNVARVYLKVGRLDKDTDETEPIDCAADEVISE